MLDHFGAVFAIDWALIGDIWRSYDLCCDIFVVGLALLATPDWRRWLSGLGLEAPDRRIDLGAMANGQLLSLTIH